MDSRQDSVSEQEWVIEFHSVKYVINVTTTDQMLTLEIENFDTSERWSGEFTSHYIEEITHKAGNLKKFSVFTKMLSSSFSRDNESVFVDILTFSDLEMLKARKLGSSTGSSLNSHSMSASSAGVKQYQKRYVILTYCSEFDRVHYPLPLSFEDTPNVAALRRTISRLRKELHEKAQEAQEPANEREKELRQVVSQMRQENTELKHRLRHSGQSNHNFTATNNSSFSNGGPGPNTSADAVSAANSKLKKQVESLKRELQELSLAHEKLRTEAAREVSRWKLKIGSVNPSHVDSAVPTAATDSMMLPKGVVADLKRRVLVLEQELRSERLKSTLISGARMHPAAISTRASASYFSPGHISRYTGRDREGVSSVTRPTHSWASRSISADTALRMRSRGTSGVVQQRLAASTWGNPHGSASPKQAVGSSRASPRVPSSSSLGGSRFDPTAYQRQKQQLKELQSMSSKAWGVGVSHSRDKHRYRSPNGLRHESGYSSANSQSSHGSRRSSRTTSTIASQQSSSDNGSRKARKGRKKAQSKRLVDGVGGTYRNRRGEAHFDSETDESEVGRATGELLTRKATAMKVKAKAKGVASGHQRTLLSHHKRSSSDQWREEIDSADPDQPSTSRTNQDHPSTTRIHPDHPSTSRTNQDHPSTTRIHPDHPSTSRTNQDQSRTNQDQPSISRTNQDQSRTNQDQPSNSRTNQDHLHSIAEQRFTELIRGSSRDHPSLNDPLRSSVDSVALSNEDASRILRNVNSRSNKASKPADMIDSTSHVNSGDHEDHRASAPLDGSDSKHVSTNSSITSMNSDPRLGGGAVAQRPSDGIRSSADIIISEKVGHSTAKTLLRSSGGFVKSSRRNRRSFIDASSVSSSANLSADSAATPRPDEEISEIDKRIQALQAYLDNARTGILSSGDRPQG